MVGTRDRNMGTKDTHINFGECLDEVDWQKADLHSEKADLCIVAGTSMSLRHITHFPFQAKRTVIINLQATPDDICYMSDEGPDRSKPCHLRIWAKCDTVFMGLMDRLGLQNDPIPAWTPRDAVPISEIPHYVHGYYVQKAKKLMKRAQERTEELKILMASTSAVQKTPSSMHMTLSKEKKRACSKLAKRKAQNTPEVRNRLLALLGRQRATSLKPTSTRVTDRYGNTSFEGAVELIVGNDCKSVDSKNQCQFKWTLFVRAGPSMQHSIDQIDAVDFYLHPTFQPAHVRVSRPPFVLQRSGWGTFEVKIVITWKAQTGRDPTTVRHQLDFSRPESSKAIRIS